MNQKSHPLLNSVNSTLASLFALFAFALTAPAHPYASGLTNTAGTISFILNESADNVKVIFDGGGAGNTNDLGALAKGVQSFALGVHTSYAIVVAKVGSGTPSQISVDANNFVKFPNPRGVAVNQNPQNRNFGRVYAVNSTPATTGGRAVGRGMYLLNADLSDCLGRGNTASTGLVVYAVNASSPFKLGVGSNDVVYVNDFSTAAATTWAYTADIGSTESNLVFAGIGEFTNATVHTDSASTPVTRGSLAAGNLTLWNIEGAIAPFNSIARWDIGAGPFPWNTAPTILGNAGIPSVADLTTDVDIGADGKFFTSVNRSAGTDVPSIKCFDTDGTTLLWDSFIGGNPDILKQTRAIMVSPDGKFLAAVHDDSHVSLLPLTNGVPDLAGLSSISIGPLTANGRDMAWDAADNIYTVSSGQALLRCYSLGFSTTCITSNDSTVANGTFKLIIPATTVSVTATTPFASETGPTPGVFTLTRVSADVSGALTVNFTNTGTATFGADYISSNTNTIVFAPGQTSTNITITPVDDSLSELTETVILTVKGGGSYSATAPNPATVTIEDNDAQVLAISVTSSNSMYERIGADYATFAVTRSGATNAAAYDLTNFVYTGTAVSNVDYVAFTNPLTFNPGDVTLYFNVSPIDNAVYSGNKTVIVAAGTGTGYTPGVGSGTATIIDDEYAAESVLFADSLNGNSSANWKTNFAANNLIDDYQVLWGTNLVDFGVSNAPNGSATALRMTVNKDEGTAFGAAGVNVYPLGKSFTGNFALRFSMNLVQHDGASTTEFATFGINHSGTKSNWFQFSGDLVNNTPKDSDGIWYGVVADGSGSAPADFVQYVGNGAANAPLIVRTDFAGSFKNVFKRPPYSPDGVAGSPACKTGNPNSIWSDVEVRNLGNVIRMSINKTPVFTYTNTTAFTNGDIMLGYCDPYASIGIGSGAVYYSNVRVVNISPVITSTVKSGSNLNVAFTDDSDDAAAKFLLLGSTLVTGTYTNMSATITKTGLGTYSTTTPFSLANATKFFRIQHLP